MLLCAISTASLFIFYYLSLTFLPSSAFVINSFFFLFVVFVIVVLVVAVQGWRWRATWPSPNVPCEQTNCSPWG